MPILPQLTAGSRLSSIGDFWQPPFCPTFSARRSARWKMERQNPGAGDAAI